jgi:hypothetical protein
MSGEPEQPSSDSEIEREIRQGRKFSMSDAMGRVAGPGAMKGASPVSELQQAETAIGTWIRANIADQVGALKAVLERNLKGSELVLNNLKQPLGAVADYLRRILASDELLKEVVRPADVEWGRMMDERPYFEREGAPPNPNDPYTIESVRRALADALTLLAP